MLKLNLIPASIFDAAGVNDSTVKVNSSEISRREIVATGRMVACEFFGQSINAANKAEKYTSRLNGLDYASLDEAHRDKKLLFCAAMANKASGKEAPTSIEEVKNNRSYAHDEIFLRTMAAIDVDVLTPMFFAVLDDTGMGLMQWEPVALGQTAEIDIASNAIIPFEDVAPGSIQSTTKNYLYAKTITLTPKTYAANVTIKWYQDVINGSSGRYYASIMGGVRSKIYAKLMNVVNAAASNTAYIPAGLTAATYTTQNWLAITDRVAAANGVRVEDLVAIGMRSALSNVLPVDGTGAAITGLQYGLGQRWFEDGYYPKAGGVSVLALSPAIVPTTQNSAFVTLGTGNNIFVLAKGGKGYAPIYGVHAKDTPIEIRHDIDKTANMTIDINVAAFFDIAPVFASKVGVLTSVYPSA